MCSCICKEEKAKNNETTMREREEEDEIRSYLLTGMMFKRDSQEKSSTLTQSCTC